MKVTRSAFVAAFAAPFALLASIRKAPRSELYINFRDERKRYREAAHKLLGSKLFVDGREIHQAWFVDTVKGIVKSYDIGLNNGPKQFASRGGYTEWLPRLDKNNHPVLRLGKNGEQSVELLPIEDSGGVKSITLRGRIELFAANGERLY